MWVGFILAAYSVVGNDVIQTLGPFLTSNEEKVKWYILWGFAATIMVAALINGYLMNDIDYGRLDKFDMTNINFKWYYLLPPLVLLIITHIGIPVSTTFMILTLFSLSDIPGDLTSMTNSLFNTNEILGGMIQKSVIGYIVAFLAALVIYLGITKLTEKYFIDNELPTSKRIYWVAVQWCMTGFLWFQWLTQDLANIYIYLHGGKDLSIIQFSISVLILLGLLAYIFYTSGGKVQDVVREKTNTSDIRAAAFIDLIYGIILYVFKENSLGLFDAKLPMSTTWVFIGLLAGRELGIRLNLEKKITKLTAKMVVSDLIKVFFGLVVSVILVFIIKLMSA